MNQKQYELYLKTHTNINGKWLRKRPLTLVAKRFKETRALQAKQHNTWTQWFDEGSSLGAFHGIHKSQIRIFRFSDNPGSHKSLHVDYETDPSTTAQITPDEQVPLLMTDPRFDDHRDIIEKRLNKTLPHIPKRQDLTDQYYKMEIQSQHIYTALELYQNILLAYVRSTFPDLTRPWKSTTPTVLILNIDGDPYHFVWNRNTLSLIPDTVSYTVPTDEMMKG